MGVWRRAVARLQAQVSVRPADLLAFPTTPLVTSTGRSVVESTRQRHPARPQHRRAVVRQDAENESRVIDRTHVDACPPRARGPRPQPALPVVEVRHELPPDQRGRPNVVDKPRVVNGGCRSDPRNPRATGRPRLDPGLKGTSV
jgi:type IV secretory pathway VirB10-like protein